MNKHLLADTETGEITPLIVVNKSKKKIRYNEWYAVNQNEERELMKENTLKSLYTNKGRLYHYLLSVMEYGNFSPFKPTFVANELHIYPSNLHKLKKELMEEGLIVEAIDTHTGVKGFIIPNVLFQKGEERPTHIVTMEEYEKRSD